LPRRFGSPLFQRATVAAPPVFLRVVGPPRAENFCPKDPLVPRQKNRKLLMVEGPGRPLPHFRTTSLLFFFLRALSYPPGLLENYWMESPLFACIFFFPPGDHFGAVSPRLFIFTGEGQSRAIAPFFSLFSCMGRGTLLPFIEIPNCVLFIFWAFFFPLKKPKKNIFPLGRQFFCGFRVRSPFSLSFFLPTFFFFWTAPVFLFFHKKNPVFTFPPPLFPDLMSFFPPP